MQAFRPQAADSYDGSASMSGARTRGYGDYYSASMSGAGRYGDTSYNAGGRYGVAPNNDAAYQRSESQYERPVYGQSPAGNPSFGFRYGSGVGRIQATFPQGADPEAVRAFKVGDTDGSGYIDVAELSRVMSSTVPFSLSSINLIAHLYGVNGTKRIAPAEFVRLWGDVKEWKRVFALYDRDWSGTIDLNELREGLLSLGYSISPTLLQVLVEKYDRTGQARGIDYGNFIECGLVFKGLTEKFKSQDRNLTGFATLSYETFMEMVLPFIIA